MTEESRPKIISSNPNDFTESFYFRYYSGHKGDYGHEFLEFDLRYVPGENSGILRYANNSSYKKEELIRKEVRISKLVVSQFKKIITDSEIILEDDAQWPDANRDGKQVVEIRSGNQRKVLTTRKLGSMADINSTNDPEGLRVFYYTVQDLKSLTYSLISLHFKVKPV